MAPCALTDFIAPGACILTSMGIIPERENLLREGSIPEDDGNRGEHNKVGENIVGSSSMDMDQSHPDVSPLPVSLL